MYKFFGESPRNPHPHKLEFPLGREIGLESAGLIFGAKGTARRAGHDSGPRGARGPGRNHRGGPGAYGPAKLYTIAPPQLL